MRLIICVATVAVLGGCSSMSTTYVGEAKPGAKFEGMPIVVQRPKYLKVTHKRVTFLPVSSTRVATGANAPSAVTPLGAARTEIQIETEVVSVGEVYALDLKRPAAGTTEYGVEFDSNAQYPKKVGAKIEDKTIEAATNALVSILDKVAPGLRAAPLPEPQVPAQALKISETVVRIELRSLDDPSKVYVIFQ